jgi:hypothetical protein
MSALADWAQRLTAFLDCVEGPLAQACALGAPPVADDPKEAARLLGAVWRRLGFSPDGSDGYMFVRTADRLTTAWESQARQMVERLYAATLPALVGAVEAASGSAECPYVSTKGVPFTVRVPAHLGGLDASNFRDAIVTCDHARLPEGHVLTTALRADECWLSPETNKPSVVFGLASKVEQVIGDWPRWGPLPFYPVSHVVAATKAFRAPQFESEQKNLQARLEREQQWKKQQARTLEDRVRELEAKGVTP